MGRTAKLTADQVATIRTSAAGESKTAQVTEYGASRTTLYAAIKASS